MRIWLDRIGVRKRDRPERWNRPLKRTIKCLIKKKLYNVDPRETYSLDTTWQMWLYEHLKMYREEAIDVVDLESKAFEYRGGWYSQLELIDMMIERLEFALNPKNDYNDYNTDQFSYVHEVEEIWAIIVPHMWW